MERCFCTAQICPTETLDQRDPKERAALPWIPPFAKFDEPISELANRVVNRRPRVPRGLAPATNHSYMLLGRRRGVDVDDRDGAKRDRRLEPGVVALLGGEALDEPDRDVVGEAVLEAEAEADEVDPDGLARSPPGYAGVLDGVGVDQLEPARAIPDVRILASETSPKGAKQPGEASMYSWLGRARPPPGRARRSRGRVRGSWLSVTAVSCRFQAGQRRSRELRPSAVEPGREHRWER
jgi:hypothetical protein